MPRQRRIDPVGGYHHVMNRGANRQTVFLNDADRVEFGRLLGDIHERFAVTTLAYCLMGNHYHLLLHCPNGGLSRAMQHLGGIYTEHINERHRRDGALFRGRFTSIPVDSDSYLLCAARYIHRNPLDLPGVADLGEYRWSSHRTYLGHRHRPLWLDTETVLRHFGERAAFDSFVRGTDALPPAAEAGQADISRLVELAIAVHVDDDRPAQWAGRTIAHLLDAEGIAPGSGLPGHGTSARRSALARARRRVRDNPEIGAALTMVRDALEVRSDVA
ncbi:MAG: transposase [Ilumatobacter sp.]